MGQYDEESVARQRRSRDTPFIDTPWQARYHCSKRFGSEATYCLSEATVISTTSQDPVRQLLFVVINLLVQNVWRYIHWKYVAKSASAGRRLWRWPFEKFIVMLTRATWTALAVRRSVLAIGHWTSAFIADHRSGSSFESVATAFASSGSDWTQSTPPSVVLIGELTRQKQLIEDAL